MHFLPPPCNKVATFLFWVMAKVSNMCINLQVAESKWARRKGMLLATGTLWSDWAPGMPPGDGLHYEDQKQLCMFYFNKDCKTGSRNMPFNPAFDYTWYDDSEWPVYNLANHAVSKLMITSKCCISILGVTEHSYELV